MRQLSPDLSSKMSQNLQTIGNNANPNMEVTVTRAKSTVQDSTYWTVETIREISGLGDVSVAPQRLKTHGGPSRIYEIHVRDGQVYTSIREYPDKFREGFKIQFSLGAGTSVGMAFNGEWVRYRKSYRLVTEKEPWVSWVDNTGILWVQKWNNLDTKFQLSSNVSKVKMIRAWKNLVIQHHDHGIIVAYIKTNGKVYYRNYCIQETDGGTWEYEKELIGFTGTAVNVNLFITNDYRSGFIIEDSLGKIHWLVTHRNWGGMASPAENINTSIRDIRFEVIPIKYHDFKIEEKIDVGISNLWFNVAEPIYPIPIFAENPDEQPDKILIRFNYPIDVDPTIVKNAFTIRDADNKTYNIISSQFGADATEIIFNTARFDSAKNDMTIVYNRNIVELDALNQGSRFAVDSFSFIFSVVVNPPQGFTEEHLGFSILPRFEVTQVHHTPVYTTETVMAGIANISIVVTKVGENPL